MSEVTFLEFNEMPWMRRSFRGHGFGDRNNTYCNLKGRGPWVIHCPTGNKPERSISISALAHGAAFMQIISPVFSLGMDGKGTPMRHNSLFLSDDGTDQWPATGFGKTRIRGEESSLSANTSYYFYIPEIIGGHPAVKHGVRIGYASRSKDDLEEFVIYDLGEPMPHPLTGEDGIWYPVNE